MGKKQAFCCCGVEANIWRPYCSLLSTKVNHHALKYPFQLSCTLLVLWNNWDLKPTTHFHQGSAVSFFRLLKNVLISVFGLHVKLSRAGDLTAYTTHSMTEILTFPKAHVISKIIAYDKPFILIILWNLKLILDPSVIVVGFVWQAFSIYLHTRILFTIFLVVSK